MRRIMIAPIERPSRSSGVASIVRVPRNLLSGLSIPGTRCRILPRYHGRESSCDRASARSNRRHSTIMKGYSAPRGQMESTHNDATGREPSPSTAHNHSIVRFAQPRGARGNRIQHRLYIRRRAGNHAQDLARRRLLLQSFSEVAVAGLQFFETAARSRWRSRPGRRRF